MNEDNEDVEIIFLEMEENVGNTLFSLQQDLSKINLGRAQSDIFDLIKVEYYGNMTLLPHMSVVSVIDYNKVSIEPYEKSSIKNIEKALNGSNLDFSTQIHGNLINVYFPLVTIERRDKLIKLVRQYGEKSKVAIRNVRRTAIDGVEELGLGKDITSDAIKKIEAFIKKAVSSIEDLTESKSKKLHDMR
jgi:ribosome recycling factor